MINIKNLKVNVGEKDILKGISLDFEIGKNYLLLGKNGSGKSSLASVIAGNPKYEVVEGEIEIDNKGQYDNHKGQYDNHKGQYDNHKGQYDNHKGQSQGLPLQKQNVGVALVSTQNLLEMTPDERSKSGIFLSFQNVPEIKGINLGEYLRIIYNIHLKNKQSPYQGFQNIPHPNPLLIGEGTEQEFKEITPFIFKRFIKQYLEEFCIDEAFLSRDLNVGFSGGEKRKIEMLQVKLIGPKYIILDEIDSGLDVDAFKTVVELLAKLDSPNNTFIIITHYFKIIEYFKIDKVYLLEDGKLKMQGGMEIVEEIKERGF